MAQNVLPDNHGALIVLTGQCAASLTTYATALNITQIAALTNARSVLVALPGQIHVTCDVPAGTDHLRWFEQKPGQTGFVFVADTADGE